jgi:predicted enzyme related to lactoylglutathione lyase
MTVTTAHAPGTFCWPELSTSNQAGAEKFYTGLFGWTKTETPMGPDAHYTIFQKDGKAAAAVAQMDADVAARGVPAHWLSYVATADVDASVAKAQKLGGTLVAGPFDVMEHGRMAVLNDSTGATFALWQMKQHAGINVLDEDHSLVWTELVTDDTAKAGSFYTGLFDWTTEKWANSPMDYTILKRGEAMAGGLMAKTPEMGPVPNHWMPYFGVSDTDGMVKKAQSLGATVLAPPMDVPKVGRMAVLADPTGAAFSIMQFLPMPT